MATKTKPRLNVQFTPACIRKIRIVAAHEGKKPGPFIRDHIMEIVKEKLPTIKLTA